MDDLVIIVTRLNGPQFAVNPDLLQRIDSAPDTILTLVDGTKYIVAESTSQIIELITDHRAQLIARAQQLAPGTPDDEPRGPGLSVVRSIDTTDDGAPRTSTPVRPDDEEAR